MSKKFTTKTVSDLTAKARVTKYSLEDLYAIYINMFPNANDDDRFKPVDTTKLRYVMYLRKSTEEDARQTKSIEDQKAECLARIAHWGIKFNVKTDIRDERHSAKEAGLRDVFTAMLNEVRAGKYDGIIAWHPDRLSRNMKEAGEIIDLVDKGIIKDLKFASWSFENTPAGKMLLGLAFVMAKEYSDKLSVDVSRGHVRRVKEGKVFAEKHGYYNDKDNYLRPDGDNYLLIREAWQMRVQGKTLEEIADYLNREKYSKCVSNDGTKHSIFQMNKNRVSVIFKDPIYAGIHLYGKKSGKNLRIVNLVDTYGFLPAVPVEDFCNINSFDVLNQKNLLKLRGTNPNKKQLEFLNGKVLCSCGANLYPYEKIKPSGRKYVYFKCDNDNCTAIKKNSSAQIVIDFVVNNVSNLSEDFIKDNLYKDYLSQLQQLQKDNEIILNKRLDQIRGEMRSINEKINNLTVNASNTKVPEEASFFAQEVTKNKQLLTDLSEEEQETKDELTANNKAGITFEKFLELFTNLPIQLRNSTDWELKGRMIGGIYSNFILDGVNVIDSKLKPEFGGLLKTIESNKNPDKSEWRGSNPQPHAPKACILAN